MNLKNKYRRKSPRIEMVPLIDIVFLLLVFFIYAMLSMAVHRGMSVDLPASASSEVSEESPLTVSVQMQGKKAVLYLNHQEVSADELEEQLRVYSMGAEEKGAVLLFADKAVSYQQLFTVLDRINSAGITAISLQSEPMR